ncbi:MAG TPA: DUF3883 domain-containing protein [Reyranella sp.]|nr:DUF3883 domain-containing protein [Reyranella sp.]
MADDDIAGKDWSGTELDVIVADYFVMLREEQVGRSYNKTAHRKALMTEVHRSNGSIEFKHRNISAVLTQLGLPRIDGYRPAWNFQTAIADAIGRFLRENPDPVPFSVAPTVGFGEPRILFAEPPPRPPPMPPAAKTAFERVARKFDPALRDQLNQALGLAGEQQVYEHEQRKLFDIGRRDLARKVRWVSQADGDGLGYDIRSFEQDGSERWIEVKTTRGGNTTPFYLTRNENEVARERPDAFRLYRLYDFSKTPRLFTLTPPLEASLTLEPLTFRASLK